MTLFKAIFSCKNKNYHWLPSIVQMLNALFTANDSCINIKNEIGTAVITVTIKLHWPENYRGEERRNF